MEQKTAGEQPEGIKGLSDYILQVVKLSTQFEKGQSIWFRGHGSSEFLLIPSLYRKVLSGYSGRPPHVLRPSKIFNLERSIDLSFSRQALIFLSRNSIPNTQMNRYFLKQHYKVNTRLLDWTESALVALYFAINEEKLRSKDGEVWLLLPFKLNSYTIQTLAKDTSKSATMIFSSVDEFGSKDSLFNQSNQLRLKQLFRKYYQLDVEKGEKMYPIAIYPPFLDDRMKAQQSCFTFFGDMFDGLRHAQTKDKFLYSIKIPSKAKSRILEELRLMGFNNFSVYPDLDGLGQSINDEYQHRFGQEVDDETKNMILDSLTDLSPETDDQKDPEDPEDPNNQKYQS